MPTQKPVERREIYVYRYESSLDEKPFSGYGIYSPVSGTEGFSSTAKTQKELETLVQYHIKQHPGALLISGIPDMPHYHGEELIFDYGGGRVTTLKPRPGENLEKFLEEIDFPALRRLKISTSKGVAEYTSLYPNEWDPVIRQLLSGQQTG